MITVNDLWHSTDPNVWATALRRYWQFVRPENLALEQALDKLNLKRLRKLNARSWYHFLHDEYFKWKYTQPNRYKTTTTQLSGHLTGEAGLANLLDIRDRLLAFDQTDIRCGLQIAGEIKGLGPPGASGLLALMYPTSFGTVDQFVVKALRDVEDLPEAGVINNMNPKQQITPSRGELLIRIMRRKAAKLNELFETDEWTPRKIDMVLWGTRSC